MEGRLRLREPQITPIEGGFLVSDPYGVYEKPLALTEGGLFLLSLMEGRTLEEVQEEVFKRHGVLVPRKELEELAKALEEAGLLLTERVEARLREEEEKLKRERPMRLAGLSYPEGEREARAFLEAFRASYPGEGEEARALLMPHLEPSRVPEVYGAALAALEKTPPPERIYLVGVAHRPLREKAAALPVPFQTPFGPALPDLPALQALDALLPFELFNTPLAFREEHSLELPLFFLKGRFPEARVLPLLVGRRSPELGEALKVVLRDFPGLLVLAVDLSHVGPRFGDTPLTRTLAEEARRRDLGFLERLAEGEPEAALAFLGANPTRIDGVEVVGSLLPLLRGRKGKVLAHRLDLEAPTLSAVGAGTLVL
ncbi:MEMO1 family protein [Thermus thermophilus]|uniref:MEMO1 family protein n=1 Tax=Thermus thermophilus TaxID=274 RepID=A0AAD1NY04_THETH|nr:AmmeMemoRadiSam system protein B [Thermus thermophilus]BCZ86814.1 MEMO1 family protein [Thermus thermophilus]BCZ89191.1 MEMO1 family protein [Thermus thermophilus]BCZ91823.1 MEMO1 family protein [Thermus thermophilus]